MKGRIESGQLCTIAPVDSSTLAMGDIVLCKVRGNEYLHIVKAINGGRFQIGNNRGLGERMDRRERDFRKVHSDRTVMTVNDHRANRQQAVFACLGIATAFPVFDVQLSHC